VGAPRVRGQGVATAVEVWENLCSFEGELLGRAAMVAAEEEEEIMLEDMLI
jgi:hypothetical protein